MFEPGGPLMTTFGSTPVTFVRGDGVELFDDAGRRYLDFLGGLAEGTETIAVHSLWLIIPAHAGVIATLWAAIVGVSAVQRIVAGFRDLS